MYIISISAPLISFLTTLNNSTKLQNKSLLNASCLILLLSWINSSIILYECIVGNTHCQINLWDWIETEYLHCNISIHTDLLSSSMLFTITLISLFIHLYSTEYMNNDPHTIRFIGYLSLFTFFMLLLISSNNYLFLLIGWEGVGICSYLLINFWYTRTLANNSGAKAIIINRIGDIALLLSTIIIINNFGSTNFETLLHTHEYTNTHTHILCTLLLIGAVGNSSLIGLHVWLPDAMEGPTPVSALIHAATMVTAGIFLLIRSSYILEESNISLTITAWIGAITAFFAASIGSMQSDINRIIAYSTCSQLGYMALAIGISNYSISLLHLINHAFFNSLLFLGAGIIIHTLNNDQDLRNLSNLINHTPLLYTSLLIGSLTLTGIPFLTAHFSNEQIIENSYTHSILHTLAIITAALTALYSARLLFLTFINHPQYNPPIQKNEESNASPNNISNLILTLLICASITVGYITFTTINTLIQHTITPQINNILPLSCSIITTILLLLLYQNTTFTQSNSLWPIINNFLSNAWNFNTLYNNIISENIMLISYTQSYNYLDNGAIESNMNNNITTLINTYSQTLGNGQSSNLSQLITSLLISYITFTIFINLNQNT